MSLSVGSAGAGAQAVLAKLGGAALGIVANIVLARIMGPEEFGRYALAFALGTVVVVIASGGMPFGAIRFVPGYLARSDFAAARGFYQVSLGITILGGLLCVAGMILAAWLLDQSHLMATVLPWAALIVIPAALAQSVASLLQARGRVAGPEIVQSVVRQGVTLGLILMWVTLGGAMDFRIAMAIGTLAVALAALLLWWHLLQVGQDEPRPRAEILGQLRLWMGAGAGLLVILVMAALNERVDLFVLGWLATPADLGIYSAAARISSVAILALAGLGAAYMPRISAAWANRDLPEVERLCREGALAGTALTLALTIGAFALGDFVLSVFGPEFRDGATVLTILLGGQIAVGMMGIASGLAIISGNARIALAGGATGLVINALTGLMLVPLLGMNGAAIGVVAGFVVSQALIGIWCSVRLGVRATLLPVGGSGPRAGVRHA